ncbi:hypothetical protein BDM02DRAFT_676379 [Thelephora ganbajun]|uniref:Uncharacterized protein n=1 Tax=Thelephora ganbajun TaxID=370292 RepID=A0ACB6ZRC6_THEGA|nr:hypothetical protein BDM02DRAFT_676379 [Thelephora ganbajun]
MPPKRAATIIPPSPSPSRSLFLFLFLQLSDRTFEFSKVGGPSSVEGSGHESVINTKAYPAGVHYIPEGKGTNKKHAYMLRCIDIFQKNSHLWLH